MISNEQFVNRVLDSFDKIDAKIDRLHAETEEQIKDLCGKISKTQKSIDDHLLTKKVLSDKEVKDEKNRDRKFYLVMALMGIGFTLYEITKDLIIVSP